MARYIDADKLWDNRPQVTPEKSLDYKAGFSECMWAFSKQIKHQIDNPTADVVEVVRCKDCVYCRPYNDGKLYCHKKADIFVPIVDAHDYCSYGERKEE